MRRGEIFEIARRVRTQEHIEDKQALRQAIQQHTEEFLASGRKIQEVHGAYADVGYLGDDEFEVPRAAIVKPPIAGTTGDNYARGREILRKKREAERSRKERRATLMNDGEINV